MRHRIDHPVPVGRTDATVTALSERRYEPPCLIRLGSLTELTHGATGSYSDGGGFQDNPGGSGGI
jgi:hypothetical protein